MAPMKGTSAADEIARDCLAVRLRALNWAVSALDDEALRPSGLRIGQANLLVAIARMGTARAGDLCRLLGMEKSTLSRDVEVLRRNGWVIVEEAGRRALSIRVSPEGHTLIERALPAWRGAQERARHLLGDGAADVIAARRLGPGGLS
jgi:DNA-binding MarR family transcriptional regulator